MKEKYKNKKWLKEQLVDKGRSMAELGRQFDRDITTIRYWRDKFNIEVDKEVKYPIKDYVCPVCGKEFRKKVTQKVQAVYCSQECAYKGRTLGYTKRKINGGYNTSPTKVKLKCENCNDGFIVDKTEKDRKYCSRKCFLEAHSKNMSGKGNPQWIDGSSYEKRGYYGNNWEEQRKRCYERDNYKCQICGRKCVGRKDLNENNSDRLIQCHHIKEFDINKMNNELNNLVTLCVRCHSKLENGSINIDQILNDD